MSKSPRIYLSPPHMGSDEFDFVREAFETNWIAPLGPHVDAFEREFCAKVGSAHAAALSSGTAALHLALKLTGLQAGEEVFCSSLTFCATVNPIAYEGAKPVFIDSERVSWNMDPALLEAALADRARKGRRPRAVILVHLYGQCADIGAVAALCERYGVVLIEDAAEALGAAYFHPGASGVPSSDLRHSISPGTVGRMGIYSFNGNKIITTSGGGMLVANDEALIGRARFLATQARDPAAHYEHSEIGYNYRMSNVLAGIGRGQLRVLEQRVAARRRNCAHYQQALGDLPGIEFMPEASWGRSTRWLTCVLIDPKRFGADREAVRLALAEENIEARPVWKPMHRQPVFAGSERFGGEVAEDLFNRGLCLPSGSNLAEEDLQRVVDVIRRVGG
jgi:dTDP-4-amino-4,6-dideoxygalactose transaminase